MSTPPGEAPKRWGKYRGTVLDSVDPLMLGRVLCAVPALPGMLLNWAMPCLPYAGLEEGFFSVPPEGANVWIEFEGGDPEFPIWSGCFWEEGEIPLVPELAPEAPELVKVLRNKFCTIMLNDTPGEGGITIAADPEAVEPPVTVTITSEGFQVMVGEVILLVNAESGITLTAGESVLNVGEASISGETSLVELAAEEVNITGETTVEGETSIIGELGVEGDTVITPALEVEGTLEATGMVELSGEVNAGPVVTIEGEANVAGALMVEGDANVAGLLTGEGDVNVAGGQEIEGELAVAGVILGVVVPPGL
ncbi:MAG: phage baseplate assembly protein V [Actinomycetota bacterium]|nr:phage baseplate assembly protein V [Actinomycetota bacterium]